MKTSPPIFSRKPRAQAGGYILLEVIMALTIFSVAVLGLANALKTGIETASIINRENAVRIGLRSYLEEIRRKPLAEMAASSFDDRLQATFTSTVDEITLKDRNGSVLKDLYVLHATASFGEGAEAQTETVDMYVYKPETQKK
jgi:Tfp pilus assembly protein PilV